MSDGGSEPGDAHGLYESARSSGIACITKALDTLDAAFRLYEPHRVVVAFNGGKDATVVLHLARASLSNWNRIFDKHASLTCLYLPPDASKSRTEFPALQVFVKKTSVSLQLDARTSHTSGFKAVITELQSQRPPGETLCFVMGTRYTDPHAGDLEHFSPSSAGWPAFMRVNPILKWEYAEVWEFLRGFRIPYCTLYDLGYTSIGAVEDTQPNPALLNEDGTYNPAWTLHDPTLERAGRNMARKTTNTTNTADIDMTNKTSAQKSPPSVTKTEISNDDDADIINKPGCT